MPLPVCPATPTPSCALHPRPPQVGFSGGIVVDYPHSTRAKKYYLVLMVGSGGAASVAAGALPQARGLNGEDPGEDEEMADAAAAAEGEEGGTVRVVGRGQQRRRKRGDGGGAPKKGSRAWVLRKKERMRGKGYEATPVDTKYTGRKRRRVK